jgi:hypothetical protein
MRKEYVTTDYHCETHEKFDSLIRGDIDKLIFCRRYLVPSSEECVKSLPFKSAFHEEADFHEITWDSTNQVFHVEIEGIVFRIPTNRELIYLNLVETFSDLSRGRGYSTKKLFRHDELIDREILTSIIQQGDVNNIFIKFIMGTRKDINITTAWWEYIIPMVIDEGREDLLKLIPVDTIRKDIIPKWKRPDLNCYLIEACKGRSNPFDKLKLD